MIEIKEEQVAIFLEEAIEQLQADEESKLVSITKKIESANSLNFFDAAKQMEGGRSFWTSSTQDFWLVGAGRAYTIHAKQSRFTSMEKQWEMILDHAHIYNPFSVPGTGLVALGGMSFDPQKQSTDLWKNFQPCLFTIPEFLLTHYNDNDYISINVCVKKNDHAVQLADELKRKEDMLLHHHAEKKTKLQIHAKQEIDPEKWKSTVRKATEEIKQHKVDKIVLAREVRLKFDQQADITTILANLLNTQANSFIFAYEIEGDCFVGATPERLVKVEDKELLSTCLAGTAPRGDSHAEDLRISAELLHDEKNRQEHDFVVRMIKLAIKDYCTNMNVPEKPVILPLKNLQHLYTPVTATLKEGYNIFNIIEKLHPTPALGGTPREESLAFIREQELLDRGWYGAPIGWLDSNHNGEFAVAIRSALIQGDEASLFAGCGVVKDSDPESEYQETNIKLLPMLTVLGGKQ